MPELESSEQFSVFKDCLARRILSHHGLQDCTDSELGNSSDLELDEFSSYLALEAWPTLPLCIRNASYETRSEIPDPETLPLETTALSFVDTLVSYQISPDEETSLDFLRKVIEDFLSQICAPPPVWSSTRTSECEICEREVPVTYHHLIPRSTHAKVLKKKWHPESRLNAVAWLCR